MQALKLFYRLIACGLTPFLLVYICVRAVVYPAYIANLSQRLGRVLAIKKDQPIIWIHAVSLGESKIAVTLLERLQQQCSGFQFLLTSMTETGYAYQKQQTSGLIHQYLPYDLWGWGAICFVRHYRPKMAIFVESDWWPGYVFALQDSRVPMVVVNARMSPKSYRSYMRIKPIFTRWLSSVKAFCTQDQSASQRLVDLGICPNSINMCGNIKYDTTISPAVDEMVMRRFKTRLVLLAACTHEKEEILCFDAWRQLKRTRKDLCLVIAPRHIARVQSILERLSKHEDLEVGCLSNLEQLSYGIDILIVDKIGCLFDFYCVSNAVFLGGTFVDKGGHSPVEAALAARAVVVGPYVYNIESMLADLLAIGAIDQVDCLRALVTRLCWALDNPSQFTEKGQRAMGFMQAHRGATNNCLKKILPLLQTN